MGYMLDEYFTVINYTYTWLENTEGGGLAYEKFTGLYHLGLIHMVDIFTVFYSKMFLTLSGLASDTWISTAEGKKYKQHFSLF